MLLFCIRRYRRARQIRDQQQQQQQHPQQVQSYGQPGPTPWSPAPTYPYPHDASISSAHSPTTVAASPSPKPQPPYAAYWVPRGNNDAFTGFKNELPADEIGHRGDVGAPGKPGASPVGGVMPSPPSSPGYGGQLDGEREGLPREYGGGGGGGGVPSDVQGGQHQVDPMGRFWVSPQSTGRSGPQPGYLNVEEAHRRGVFREMEG